MKIQGRDGNCVKVSSNGGEVRKAVVRKAVVGKAVVGKAVVRKAVMRKAVVRKAVVGKAVVRKAVVRKVVVRKVVVRTPWEASRPRVRSHTIVPTIRVPTTNEWSRHAFVRA